MIRNSAVEGGIMMPTQEPPAPPEDQDVAVVQGGAADLTDIARRLTPDLARAEPRQRALAYVRGWLRPAERKHSWQWADGSGEATPSGFQYVLGRADWEADARRNARRTSRIQHLGDPEAVLVIEETGFLKKGHQLAGGARQ
jgi:SRSO17 transposase